MQTVPRRRDSRPTPAPRRRRDRRGRGIRGGLAPREVPLHRTPSEAFDDLVLDAVEDLEEHWATELAEVEFAVEDVPPRVQDEDDRDQATVVDRGVPLGRLMREGVDQIPVPVVVVYRRPIEARAMDRDDCADLVFMVVAELVADLLGRDVDEIDPP